MVADNFVHRDWVDDLGQSYPGAFSAADLTAVLTHPNGSRRVLGNLAAVSISTHRDAFPVVRMNQVGPQAILRGHRTLGGTLLFHTIDRAAFSYGIEREFAAVTGRARRGPAYPDELPPFDVHLVYINEVGMLAHETVFGIVLLDMGKAVSVEGQTPLEHYTYMAAGYSQLEPITPTEPLGIRLERQSNRERQPLRYGPSGNLDATTQFPVG